jgi:hypothetical protein
MRFTRSGRQLLYVGRPVSLAGIMAGTGSQTTTDFMDPPFDDDFARLTQHDNNFHRHWLTPYWAFSPVQKPETERRRNSVFQRSLEPKMPGARWLLFDYNYDYFSRLQGMLTRASQLGIVVQLVLFDRSGLDTTGSGGPESWPPGANPGYPVRRWDDSPWNVDNNDQPFLQGTNKGTPENPKINALPEFFLENPPLRKAQQAYIEQVVNATKGYWNVFYEIMNEPQGLPNDAHVRWADWVVGVIHGLTGGNSIIFYNDHNPTADGADVNLWKDLKLPNYGNFHGVSFHRVPTSIDPNAPNAGSKFKFLNEKIFQVSTDGNSRNTRDTQAANDTWTGHAFSRGMIFQAQSISPDAASGIQQHHPTPLK